MPGQWEELTDEFDALADDGQRFHMLVLHDDARRPVA